MCSDCLQFTCPPACPGYVDKRPFKDICEECGEPIRDGDEQIDIEHGNGTDTHYHKECLTDKAYTVVIEENNIWEDSESELDRIMHKEEWDLDNLNIKGE